MHATGVMVQGRLLEQAPAVGGGGRVTRARAAAAGGLRFSQVGCVGQMLALHSRKAHAVHAQQALVSAYTPPRDHCPESWPAYRIFSSTGCLRLCVSTFNYFCVTPTFCRTPLTDPSTRQDGPGVGGAAVSRG